jgi:hypothetical protein
MTAIKKNLLVVLGLTALSATSADATYVDAVNALNPIRYYRFEDASTASGASLDDIGSGNDDTTYGTSTSSLTGPALDVANTAVNGGGALIGSGSITADLPGASQDVSFMFWFRRTSTSGGALLGYGTANGRAVYHGDGALPLRAGERGKNELATGDLDLDKWYFAAVTIEGATTGNWRIYTAEHGDTGVTLSAGPLANGNGNSNNNGPLTIGNADQFTPAFVDLDELAVFNVALSEAQINSVFSTVPEPVSLVLVGIASLMLALRRVRR